MSKVEREDFLMEDLRMEDVCSDRVCEILKRAQERYYKMYLRHDLTSEFLLFILIEDGESLISQYMYNERLFSCYIRKKDLKRCPIGEDKEDFCYMLLLAMIEDGIDTLETKYYIKDNKKSITTSLGNVFLQAKEIAERLGKKIIDEEAFTIALVQCNNPIWEMLAGYDVEDIANGMILSYFCENNMTEEGFLEEPIRCEGGYN